MKWSPVVICELFVSQTLNVYVHNMAAKTELFIEKNVIWVFKLYIELSKNGIGKYFKDKNIIL